MASGIIWTPDERATQPRGRVVLSSSTPLTQGIVSCVVGGQPVNIKTASALTVSGATTVATQNGLAYSFASGNYIDTEAPNIPVTPGQKWSVLALIKSTASGVNFVLNVNYNGSTVPVSLAIGAGVATSGAAFYDGLAWRNSGVNTDISGDSLWHVVAGVRNDGVMLYFIDGRLDASATVTQNAGAANTNAATWGQYKNDAVGLVGQMALGVLWNNSALTADQIQSLSRNPWQLFEADNDPVFYSLGGGSNNTATLSSTLEAATLAGVGAITRSGTLAVTLDTATLSGVGGVSLSGTLASTLADATLAGIGAVTTSGTLSVTLEDATLAGVGSVAVGTNRDGALAVTLEDVTAAGIGAVTRSATLAVTLDNATLAGIGTAGQAVTGTLAVTLDNATLSGVGAIPAAPSHGGGNGTGRNLSRKQKKKLKAVESQEWLKAEETARQLLNDRFTKQTPQEKAQALQTYVESLQPIIEALKAITTQIEEVKEVVEDAPIIELTPHQEILSRFDTLEKKLKSVEELVIILMADL